MEECLGHSEQKISKECTICLNHKSDIKKEFLEAFTKGNAIESYPIRQWKHFLTKHKHESSGINSIDSLAFPCCYAGAMMCRLFGVHDFAKFSIEMVPLMEAAVNSYIMDWATIFLIKWPTKYLIIRKTGS